MATTRRKKKSRPLITQYPGLTGKKGKPMKSVRRTITVPETAQEYLRTARRNVLVKAITRIANGEQIGPQDLETDPVHPQHYREHPSGIECIDIVRHENFNIGNVFKYLWRHRSKPIPIEELRKAAYYLNNEIDRVEKYGT